MDNNQMNQQGYSQQPEQQGYAQQSEQQAYAQQSAQPGYAQQPMQQGYAQPVYAQPVEKPSVGLGVASMVTGILALVLGCCVPYVPFILALIAVILGGVSLAKKKGGKGMAITGLVCGIISLVPAVIIVVAGASVFSMLGVM